MARLSKNTKFSLLFKTACGLVLICYTVFVIGQIVHGVSAKTILFKSSLLLIVVGLSMHVIVRLWAQWNKIKD